MIDTIIIKVHNIEANLIIVNHIWGAKGAFTKSEKNISDVDFADFKQKQIFFKNLDQNKTVSSMPFTTHVYSSINTDHYSVASRINYVQDFIEFNFSIPKYMYGHNIAQFVPPNKNIAAFNENYLKNAETVYNHIFKFLDVFFVSNFGYCPDFRFISVTRLDLCFNMFFETKKQALSYIQAIAVIRKKYMRSTSNYLPRTTSLYHITKNVNYNIYHKGSEYEANDKKVHQKLNIEHKKKIFDTDLLQDISDKIVRFEAKYKDSWMSQQYLYHFWRKDCSRHRNYFTQYKTIKKLKEFHIKDYLKLPKWKKNLYNDFNKKLMLKKDVFLKNDFEYIQHYLRESPKLMYLNKYSVKSDDIHIYNIEQNHESRIRLSYPLFKHMCKHFNDFLSQYIVNELPTKIDIIKIVEEHNKIVDQHNYDNEIAIQQKKMKRKSKMNKNKIAMIVQLLNEYSLDEIKNLKLFDDRTFYRYKSDLKQLGVNPQSLNYTLKCTIDTTFKRYYETVLTNFLHFKSKNFIFDLQYLKN